MDDDLLREFRVCSASTIVKVVGESIQEVGIGR